MRLKTLRRSTHPAKKYDAIFETDSGRTRTVRFGAAGMSDYTIHKDKTRRARYLARHKAKEDWEEPATPGALSKWLLWGPSTSLETNLKRFKKRFKV